MQNDYGIEEYAEASASVVAKLISGVFRIIYAVFYGVVRGLCLLPIFRGISRAVKTELERTHKAPE